MSTPSVSQKTGRIVRIHEALTYEWAFATLGFSMALTASKLRENIYQLLDRVLETRKPLEIWRKGRLLKISPAETRGKLDRLVHRSSLKVSPEEIVHIDWSKHWKPKIP